MACLTDSIASPGRTLHSGKSGVQAFHESNQFDALDFYIIDVKIK